MHHRRYAESIQWCLTKAKIADEQNNFQDWLIKVLFYEVLFGLGKIQGGGTASRFVKENLEKVKDALTKLMVSKGAKTPQEVVPASERPVQMPRYVRVNTLKISVPDAIAKLQEGGYVLLEIPEVVAAQGNQRKKCFARDNTLQDVLMFPPGIDLHDHPMVITSELRLQDKASCFPAHVLAAGVPPIKFALDACSAPGNKTTHLGALMNGEGRLIAVELDRERANLLRQTVRIMDARNVEVVQGDFLALPRNRPPYCEVEAIMLDPSCSGSGIGKQRDVVGHVTDASGLFFFFFCCLHGMKSLLLSCSVHMIQSSVYIMLGPTRMLSPFTSACVCQSDDSVCVRSWKKRKRQQNGVQGRATALAKAV
jgi:putative methyltransferase